MRQVAALVEIHPSRFWRLVRERETLEAPEIQAGRRWYYDDAQVRVSSNRSPAFARREHLHDDDRSPVR